MTVLVPFPFFRHRAYECEVLHPATRIQSFDLAKRHMQAFNSRLYSFPFSNPSPHNNDRHRLYGAILGDDGGILP